MKTCPKCGKKYSGYHALSREDNKTEICSDCGVAEALKRYVEEVRSQRENKFNMKGE